LTEKEISDIKKYLTEKKKIVILTHINPDGDAIGSSLAMYHYLKTKNHQVNVITPNDSPLFLKWMPGSEHIIVFNTSADYAENIVKEAEIIFCLDFNALKRIDKIADSFRQSAAIKILMDHHIEPENFTDYTFSKIETSSTSEMVYDFMVASGDEKLINQDIATCLYVGIATDTGSFSYSCNYPQTYQSVSKLVETGIDAEQIHRLVYDTYSDDRMRLLGYCLSKKMTVITEYKTAYISLTKDEMKHFNHQTGDTEGIVNFPLSIGKVQMAVLFIEKDDHIRISLRSKGKLNVNDIAKKYFNGGGHKNAAGANAFASMSDTIHQFIKILPELNFTNIN